MSITKQFKMKNDIMIFNEHVDSCHADFDARELDRLYREEERHFWFIARKEFILNSMKKYINQDANIIEIGAGTGNVARYLQNNFYTNMSVGEMHLNGLQYAKTYGMKKLYQFDLLDSPFLDEFDGVCMFDVLEHIEDDKKALSGVCEMLKGGGE